MTNDWLWPDCCPTAVSAHMLLKPAIDLRRPGELVDRSIYHDVTSSEYAPGEPGEDARCKHPVAFPADLPSFF